MACVSDSDDSLLDRAEDDDEVELEIDDDIDKLAV